MLVVGVFGQACGLETAGTGVPRDAGEGMDASVDGGLRDAGLDATRDAPGFDAGDDAGDDAGVDAATTDANLCGPPNLVCGTECVDPTIDVMHCGGCMACPVAPGTSATCAAGVCGTECLPGFADCDLVATNGCEIETARDVMHCGACASPCLTRFGVLPGCSMGICTYMCAGGLFDCDGIEANGCEVDPRADPLHCGSCDPCPALPGAVAGCSASTCTYACDTTHLDCDGSIGTTGCEVSVLDLANCGACGLDCRTGAPPGTTPTCAATGCTYPCDATHLDCDGNPATGCEVTPASDPLHCGGCSACAPRANATAGCAGSACSYTCVAPYDDCNGLAGDGCETDLSSTVGSCGMCGSACPVPAFSTATCGGSTCGFVCNAGHGDCNVLPGDGCEIDTTSSVAHCSACGAACPARANATIGCAASACTFTCLAGYADCRGGAADGCETELASSATDCGMCGRACPPGRTCGTSACHGWTPTSTTSAPSGRRGHTAVWTGTEMIVWGGVSGVTPRGDGARYDPATDTWAPMNALGAPSPRWAHTAVWTGSEMIVWGGFDGAAFVGDGARYDPATDTWTSMTASGAPGARARHVAVFGASRMTVWSGATAGGGGDAGDGRRYVTDAWSAVAGGPQDRRDARAVWTGSLMFVWGGETGAGVALNSGGRYNPMTDAWLVGVPAAPPAARARHTLVWAPAVAPAVAIVWGGDGGAVTSFGTARADGGRYDPAANTWSAIAASPLGARTLHTAVWTGSAMVVWGGYGSGIAMTPIYANGAAYRATLDTWSAISDMGAPSGRYDHTAVWTGTEMIVWGGETALGATSTGGRFAF